MGLPVITYHVVTSIAVHSTYCLDTPLHEPTVVMEYATNAEQYPHHHLECQYLQAVVRAKATIIMSLTES
jgi:hypothetical protein